MKGLVGRILVYLIRGYQQYISPRHGPRCRFIPTCSQYAIEAIETHGALKGSALAVWRILRCNPFSKGGYDPVPPKRERLKQTACDPEGSPHLPFPRKDKND